MVPSNQIRPQRKSGIIVGNYVSFLASAYGFTWCMQLI